MELTNPTYSDFIIIEERKKSIILSKSSDIILGTIFYSDRFEEFVFEISRDLELIWSSSDLIKISDYINFLNSKRLTNER